MTSLVQFSTPIPLKVDLNREKARVMLDILKATSLPSEPPIPGIEPWDLGIDLKFLKEAKARFESDWSFDALQEKINEWPNFTVHYDHQECRSGAELHYIHARSKRPDAIPLILLHGWPGKSSENYN